MLDLLEYATYCPYCGEPVTLLVDTSVDSQQYIEDCQVCCRPIQVDVSGAESGSPQIELRTGDE